MRTLVVGSIAFDHSFRYDGSFLSGLSAESLTELSVSFRMQSGSKRYGGNALNVGTHLKLLEEDPLLLSTVGSDGEEILSSLQKLGIGTEQVSVSQKALTATAIIATDTDMRQITFYHPGADAERAWQEVDPADIGMAFVGPSQAQLTMRSLEWCEKHNIPCIFDPGQQTLDLRDDELWKAMHFCTGLVANSYEWDMIGKRLQTTPEQLLQESIFNEEMDPSMSFIVITRGVDGFTLYEGSGRHDFPACHTSGAINPTPAGDAFQAGLIAGLNRKWPLALSAKLGAAVAAVAVEQTAVIPTALDWNDLAKRVKETYGEELPAMTNGK